LKRRHCLPTSSTTPANSWPGTWGALTSESAPVQACQSDRQTPQAFTRALLWEAHDKARRDGFAGTDDAVLVERLGVTVTMVLGLGQNLKITTPEDLQAARAWAVPRRRK